MIRIILIMVIALGFAGQSWGQENEKSQKKDINSNKDTILKSKRDKNFIDKTHFIEYDFQTGKYQNDLKRIKVHTPVVFKIKNINPFAYNVKITPKDSVLASSSFDADVVSALKLIKTQEGEDKLLQTQTETNKSITNQVQSATLTEYKGSTNEQKTNKSLVDNSNTILINEEKIQNLKAELAKKQTDLIQLQEIIKLDNAKEINDLTERKQKIEIEINQSVNDETKTDKIGELKTQLNNTETSLRKLNDKIKTDSISIASKITTQKLKLETDITVYEEELKRLNENKKKLSAYTLLLNDFVEAYKQYMEDSRLVFKKIRITKQIAWIAEKPNLKYQIVKASNLEHLVKELETDLENIDNYRKSYTEFSNAYYKMMAMHQLNEIMEPSGVSKTLGYPSFLKIKADQISEVLAKYQIDDVIKRAIWIGSILNEEENFNVKSYPIQPENDLVQFIVEIKKRNEKDLDQYYKLKKFTYQQPIYGGTRVDFSLGLAASYYADVNVYELNKESEITTLTKDIVSPSLIGMVTMSRRKTGYFAYGGSAGMGLDVANGKIQLSNFFIGPTLLIGKKDRIFFTIGASLKNVRQLKEAYKDLKIPATTDFTSYTRDNYKAGLFASLTYSLTKDAKTMIKNLR